MLYDFEVTQGPWAKVTCGPKRRLPDGQMRTEEYKSSIWRRWSSRTFSTAAITLLNCRSLAEFISLKSIIFWRFEAKKTIWTLSKGVRPFSHGVRSPCPWLGSRPRSRVRRVDGQIIVPFILFLKIFISDWRFVVFIGDAFAIFSVFAISFATLSFTLIDQYGVN